MRKNLKLAREAANLTQEQVAQYLGFRSKSHYCMIENGQRGISVENAIRIAGLLERPVEELFSALEVHEAPTSGETGSRSIA
jgi:transcriptional regulator with XRE-family HTH domain